MATRRFSIFLNVYFLAVFVGIGGLQMYGVNAGVLTSYGADLLAPPWIYLMFRGGRWRMGPLRALLLVFCGCLAWEWAQRYDFSGTPLAITRGTFDPLDILAYATGLLVCYAVDVLWLTPKGLMAARPGAPAADDIAGAGSAACPNDNVPGAT
ncbi:MAG TPA: hypothetical protein VMM77_03595 [Gemmatimonadaceae bacterium]|nr:hypothetical protein [Gemmatimonadaceae bacterium]